MNDEPLARLQRWYADQCDGEWEHEFGVEIDTLDNPGWRVLISLNGTALEQKAFDRLEVDRTDDDWLRAWTEDGNWNAACGPLNLHEAVETFLGWASS